MLNTGTSLVGESSMSVLSASVGAVKANALSNRSVVAGKSVAMATATRHGSGKICSGETDDYAHRRLRGIS